MIITDKLKEQILAIRNSGKANMLDTASVQYSAHQQNMYELVILIEENKRAYLDFILDGTR
ncbi:DUF5049 domain-containing protein [Eubacteriales bacterium OttesenSCG-928-A19]|nr:DUF5049 domain-containing protein [Eubacteriales bacterium OttesenSCG-928-A19]